MAQTVVDKMVSEIARGILNGAYAVGMKLPSYRALAREFGVTLPTAQRAVGRIDELGLVEVRHGSGAVVLDPSISATPGVLPYWVAAVLDQPERACAIVADFLHVRRELAGVMVARLIGADLRSVVSAVDEMERLVVDGAPVRELMSADHEVIRQMLSVAPSVALASVFNAFSALQRGIEPLAEAMYAEPALNVAGYRAVVSVALDGEEGRLRMAVPTTLAALDAATLNRFRRTLEEQCLDS